MANLIKKNRKKSVNIYTPKLLPRTSLVKIGRYSRQSKMLI